MVRLNLRPVESSFNRLSSMHRFIPRKIHPNLIKTCLNSSHAFHPFPALSSAHFFSTDKPLRSSNHSKETNVRSFNPEQIADLVKHRGLISLVDENGDFHSKLVLRDVLERAAIKDGRQKLMLVKIQPTKEPDTDPGVTCKLVANDMEFNTVQKSRGKKTNEKKKKIVKNNLNIVKPVDISWTITEKDLQGQKKLAIESILTKRRCKMNLTIASKTRRRQEITPLQVEQRTLLVGKCTDIIEKYGLIKEIQGSIYTKMNFEVHPFRVLEDGEITEK